MQRRETLKMLPRHIEANYNSRLGVHNFSSHKARLMRSQRRRLAWPQLGICSGFIAGAMLVGCAESEPPAAAPPGTPSPVAAKSAAQRHLEAAKQLSAEQNYSAAIDEYTTALAAMRAKSDMISPEPVDANVLFERGIAYLNLGFPDTASADFTEVLRMRPDFGAAYAKRGEAYTKLGDLYKAVRDCTDAIRYEPECAYAYRYRGQAYLARGQFERAAADLEQAVAMDSTLEAEARPLRARAYQAWGEQLARADRLAEADAKFAQARSLDPGLVSAADSATTSDESDEAVELTAAKQVIDGAAEALERGVTRLMERQYDQALTEFSAAIDARPDFAEAYLRRGETLLIMDFPDTAVKDLEQAIHYGADSVKAHQLQARAFMALDSPHRAAVSATDALHVDPSDAVSYALRGQAYVELEKWDRGIVDLEEAIRRDPNLADNLRPTLQRAYNLRDAAQMSDVSASPSAS